MTRSAETRRADVRRLVDAARSVYERRASLVETIARATGLSPAGVELGFESLEREASDAELDALEASVSPAGSVHVVLSANVFVAPLRALALARAAAARVTVRPSPRDPWLTRALLDAAADPAITLTDERDVSCIEADAFHVYGRAASVDAVRHGAGGRAVWGHGPGMGGVWLTLQADLAQAAQAIARDVVAFDQRGCLSPRIVWAEGERDRAEALARALGAALAAWGDRVPRGSLSPAELAEARRWVDITTLAGPTWVGRDHAVALSGERGALAIPPVGRHVLIRAVASSGGARADLASIAPSLVAVGTDDLLAAAAAGFAPAHARVSTLGRMQQPPLDGPVDGRGRGDGRAGHEERGG